MVRTACVLSAIALVLTACDKKDAAPATSEPSAPTPMIEHVSAAERAPFDKDWQVSAWDVTTPVVKGFLAFRLVDRDGSVQQWSSKTRVGPSAKMRVTFRFRVIDREIEVRWSMMENGRGAKGDGKVAIAEGGGISPSLTDAGIPFAREGHPLIVRKWHALLLCAWSPKGTQPAADVPMGEEWFTLRLDGREVDLKTYGFPVLQAHVRFTQE
jgi:hypothetical protein